MRRPKILSLANHFIITWFNREISEAKKAQREAERTWRISKLEVHCQIFVETRNKTHKLIVTAKKNT